MAEKDLSPELWMAFPGYCLFFSWILFGFSLNIKTDNVQKIFFEFCKVLINQIIIPSIPFISFWIFECIVAGYLLVLYNTSKKQKNLSVFCHCSSLLFIIINNDRNIYQNGYRAEFPGFV